MFSGGAGWAEIQRRCFCVGASAKHNKTLWGMNQTQSDRDTKAHMLIHSVNFTMSLPFSRSLFFNVPVFLSFFPINWPSYYCHGCPVIVCFGAAGLLSFLNFAKFFMVSAKCHVRLLQTGLKATSLEGYYCVCACVDAHMRECAQASMCVPHTHHGLNGPANPVPSLSCFHSLSHLFCPFNSLSSTVLLLSCSARRAVIEGVRQ